MTEATPPFPEAALRAVLAGTVAAWAGAGQPQAPSAEGEPRRLYLDAFAGAEFQFGTGVGRSGDEETRAAAAFRALDQAGLAPPPIAVFAEEDPAHLGRIYAELEDSAGGERLRATRDLASLQAGEISLLEAAFTSAAGDVARYAAGARAFALLAPPAARALPWDALRQLASLPDATVLIRLPHSDFEKQSRHTGSLADLPAFARRIVEGCSAMLDDPKHAWLPAWRAEASARGQAAALAGVLERFRALLDGISAGRILKPMELEAADGARTWLFLLTPDPAVALAANAAVRAAKLADRAAAANPISAPNPPRPASPAAPSATRAPAAAPAAGPASDDASASASPTAEPPGVKEATPAVTGEATGPEASPAPVPRKKGRRGAASPASPPPADTTTPPADAQLQPDQPSAELPAAELPSADRTPGDAATAPPPPASSDSPRPSAPSAASPTPTRPAVPPPPKPEPVAEFLDLFPEELEPSDLALPVRPDPSVLAAAVEARFASSTVAWREILRAFAATDVTPTELKAALAVLRRSGHAAYKALKGDEDRVEFLAEPIVREKPKRRRKPADDGGLFGSGEGANEEGAAGGPDGGAGEQGE
ncbi:MAG TPA: hypothetical protein VFJ16_20350 [Longimicrobium sp.]|nr:hypothetical protein [Longimicrobium sp.]